MATPSVQDIVTSNLNGSVDRVGRISLVIFLGIFLVEVGVVFVIIQLFRAIPMPFVWMGAAVAYVGRVGSTRFSGGSFVRWPFVAWHELFVGYVCLLSLAMFVCYTVQLSYDGGASIFGAWYFILFEFVVSSVILLDFVIYMVLSESPAPALLSMGTVGLATVAPG